MQVYQTDSNGFFVSEATADRSPLEKDTWLIPRGCVTEKPPTLEEGQSAKWEGGAWVIVSHEPEPEPETPVKDPADEIREERNYRLSGTDWTQLNDSPVDKAVWAAYRQELRDVPQQAGFPSNVIWPERPE